MKILFLTEGLWAGGRERRLVELLKGLSNVKDITCELVSLTPQVHYTEIFNLNIKIHFIKKKYKLDPFILSQLYKIYKNFQPDIIHSWGEMWSLYVLPILMISKAKFANGMITSAPDNVKLFSQSWFIKKLTFPFSDIILSNSIRGLSSYRAPVKKSKCIHNGFDFERTTKLTGKCEIKKKHGINTSNVVGMVAYFTERKDYGSYLNCAREVIRKNNDVTFLAIGDGPTLLQMRERLEPNGEERIKFLGVYKDIESLINVFDIGVLLSTSKIHGEGISNSIIEYMALGKPVIATEGGGTRELIINGENGFLIKDNNLEELVSKVEFLLANKKEAQKIGDNNKKKIASEFDIYKMIENFVHLYKDIIT